MQLSQSVVMPSGMWNDFTDLPAEFLSQFGPAIILDPEKQGCFYTSSFVYFATAMDDLLIVACLIATFFNLLVIGCSAKLYQEKGDTLHLFILNMTLGDTILTVLCHPYELVTRRHLSVQIHSITVFLNFANWVGLAVSGLSLTLLNVDKLIFFCWPFQYDTWMSFKRAKMFCISTWVISIAFATYYWMYSYIYYLDRKPEYKKQNEIQFEFLTAFMNGGKLSPINKFFYEVFTIIFCVIPIVSSLLVSCYLYDLTRRKRKITLPTANSAKNENKATSFAFIFATTLWTSCSLLPYRLTNLARIHVIAWPSLDCGLKQTWSWFTWCMLYILILNPIVNPLITAFAYAPYRQLIFSMFINSPLAPLRSYISKFLVWAGNKKKKQEKRYRELNRVYHVELPMPPASHPLPLSIRKAPLARLPSICSCGSLASPYDIQCTRF